MEVVSARVSGGECRHLQPHLDHLFTVGDEVQFRVQLGRLYESGRWRHRDGVRGDRWCDAYTYSLRSCEKCTGRRPAAASGVLSRRFLLEWPFLLRFLTAWRPPRCAASASMLAVMRSTMRAKSSSCSLVGNKPWCAQHSGGV